jgi:IS4 transposase
MILSKTFERFARQSPTTVMMRGVMEYALPKNRLDDLFRRHASEQREDDLMFSSVVDCLSLAVNGRRRSVNAAYVASQNDFQVSVNSLYNKLQGVEPRVAQALVRESAHRLRSVLIKMKATSPPLLEGYRTKIIDGKHLGGTENRLKETRKLRSAPLPGHLLTVLDPELSLAVDVFPCEDAYIQERALLHEVLETVHRDDLWIADRNFCTTGFLFGIRNRKGYFLIRQHGSNLSGKRLKGREKRIKRCDTGVVYEQAMEIDAPETGETMVVRRIRVKLDKPTRDGDENIYILTNLPAKVPALRIAQLFLHRWKIENLFGELSQSLNAEINTLCYPKAALLAYCVGLLTYNVVSTVKGSLQAAHGNDVQIEELSTYYIAEELGAIHLGMMIAIEPRKWTQSFGTLTVDEMAAILHELASLTDAKRFRKNKRGPRKPPTRKAGNMREKHVSTQRILNERKKAQMC